MEKTPVNQITKISSDEASEGSVVAVQYPATVDFQANENTGKELAETYGHLKQLDPDSNKQYEELTDAIKIVSKARIANEKEEKAIKDPLNAFKQLVIDTGKKIRSSIVSIEDDLKNEKQRIDDIRQEKQEALEELWHKNLDIIRKLANDSVGLPADKLENHLQIINLVDLEDYDLGDLIEDAKAALANAHAIAEQGIAQEKQRVKLAAEQAAFEKEQREAKAAQKIIDDAAAETLRLANEKAEKQQKIIDDLEAEKKAREKPEPEPERKGASLSGIAGACGIPVGEHNEEPEPLPRTKLPPADTSDFDDEPVAVTVGAEDYQKMVNFMAQITALIENAPLDFENQNCSRSVNRVVGNFSKAFNYLHGVAKGGEA
jgi:hypothetical protein